MAALRSLLLTTRDFTEFIARNRREGSVAGDSNVCRSSGAHRSRVRNCRSGRSDVRSNLRSLHQSPFEIIDTNRPWMEAKRIVRYFIRSNRTCRDVQGDRHHNIGKKCLCRKTKKNTNSFSF